MCWTPPYTRRRQTKRQSRETGNIWGTQDEEKQNDNPEAAWGVHKMKKNKNTTQYVLDTTIRKQTQIT